MFNLFRRKLGAGSVPKGICPEGRQETLERIVPVVKVIAHEQLEATPIDLPADHIPVSRSLVADLIVLYAEDLPHIFSFISRQRMEGLGLLAEELHALAVRNLQRRVPPIKLHGEPPRFMVTCGGNFEATLLLHEELWEAVSDKLPGEPMAAVPARDLLFVSSSGWEGAYSFLLEIAGKELEDKRYALSKRVLIRRNGVWHDATLAS